MSDPLDFIRQNPDIKEQARTINHMQTKIKNLEDQLRRLLNLVDSKRITETRTKLELVPDHTHPLLSSSDLADADSTDSDAFHANADSEVQGVLTNVTPAAADEFIIEDASDSNNKKAVLFSALEGAIDHDNITGVSIDDHHAQDHASRHHPSGADELLLDEDNMATDSATKGASQQSIKAYVDEKEAVGSTNELWEPLALFVADDFSNLVEISGNMYINSSQWVAFRLNLPAVKDGLNLQVQNMRIAIRAADTSNYINRAILRVISYNTITNVIDDSTNKTSANLHTYTEAAAQEVADGEQVVVQILSNVAGASNLQIMPPEVHYYYA